MHDSVAQAFVDFSKPLEGMTTNAYLDVKGLVTVGVGCLIDPIVTALPLPWVKLDGSVASASQVESELQSLKSQQGLKNYPALSANVKAATTIRLTEDGVLQLAKSRLAQNEAILRKYFPDWDSFPADLQLCCFSMAWAIGAGFPAIFGNFTRLVNAGAYKDAIQACDIRTEGNPGIVPRNAANKLCLSNAWISSQRALPRGQLFWPHAPPDAGDANWSLRNEAEVALANMPPLDLSHGAEGEEEP